MKQNRILRGRKITFLLTLFFFLLCVKSPVSVKADLGGFFLKEQENVLYVGGTCGDRQPFGVCAPDGMCEVKELTGKNSEFVIRYGTDAPKVCGVTEDGIIVAISTGEALVTAVIELNNGESFVFTRQITVKPAEVVFTQFTEKFKVGEKVLFQVEVYGYDEASLRWMTAKRGGAVVGKNEGKTKAVIKGYSSKEDVVMLYIGDIVYSHKIKVET